MNWQSISGNPFFTVALLIVVTLFINGFWQNKRIDDLRDSINQRFNAVDKRFDAVDKRLDAVDRRFEAVDKRFDGVDRRLEKIESKIDGHADRIAKLEGPALVRSGD